MRHIVGGEYTSTYCKVVAVSRYERAVGYISRLCKLNQRLLGVCDTVNVHRMRHARYRIGKIDGGKHLVSGKAVQSDKVSALAHSRVSRSAGDHAVPEFREFFTKYFHNAENVLTHSAFRLGVGAVVKHACRIAGDIDDKPVAVQQCVEPRTAEHRRFSLTVK